MKGSIAYLFVALASMSAANAKDLVGVYQDAMKNDPQIRQADANPPAVVGMFRDEPYQLVLHVDLAAGILELLGKRLGQRLVALRQPAILRLLRKVDQQILERLGAVPVVDQRLVAAAVIEQGIGLARQHRRIAFRGAVGREQDVP